VAKKDVHQRINSNKPLSALTSVEIKKRLGKESVSKKTIPKQNERISSSRPLSSFSKSQQTEMYNTAVNNIHTASKRQSITNNYVFWMRLILVIVIGLIIYLTLGEHALLRWLQH
jgi:hypothetical protein